MAFEVFIEFFCGYTHLLEAFACVLNASILSPIPCIHVLNAKSAY